MRRKNEVHSIPQDILKQQSSLFSRLKKISVQTSFTEELKQSEPLFLEKVLAQYNIPFQKEKIPPTFFIPQSHLWQAEKIVGESLASLGGKFFPVYNFALVILTEDPILDTHSTLHESAHGLGRRSLWRSGKYMVSRVGYSYFSNLPGKEFSTGNFLEEATADFIATKTAVELLQSQNIALPDLRQERHIAEYAGGTTFAHMRDCLIFLSANIPELLPLFLRSRFDHHSLVPLAHTLHKHFGKGAMQTLNRMHSRETPLNDELIMLLKDGENILTSSSELQSTPQ